MLLGGEHFSLEETGWKDILSAVITKQKYDQHLERAYKSVCIQYVMRFCIFSPAGEYRLIQLDRSTMDLSIHFLYCYHKGLQSQGGGHPGQTQSHI